MKCPVCQVEHATRCEKFWASYAARNAQGLKRVQLENTGGLAHDEVIRLFQRVQGMAVQCKTREEILAMLSEVIGALETRTTTE